MVALSAIPSSSFVKVLYCGDSGTGKTGSLVSLVKAGYKLRILDMDNGVKILKSYIMKECPDRLGAVDVETRRDEFRFTPSGPIIKGLPKAYTEAAKLLTKWSDETEPSEWGADTILVLDSLTALGDAAFEWAKGLAPGVKDPRQWYGTAQDSIEHIISLLTSDNFHAHVIVITHVKLVEVQEGNFKHIPTSIGTALGRTLPRFFNNMIQAESTGAGKAVRRTIRTVPTGLLDLKNEAPFAVSEALPLESGVATLFADIIKSNNAS